METGAREEFPEEIEYYAGYKYVVKTRFKYQTDIFGYEVKDILTSLDKDGVLTVEAWYPWDGNSGPVPDFKSTMKGSCVHDILCDYINMGWIPLFLQPIVDQEYYKICSKRGLWEWVARLRLIAVRWYQTGKGAKRFHRKVLKA